jgi:hypothetical protein
VRLVGDAGCPLGARANLSQRAWRFVDGREIEARGEIVAAGLDAEGQVRMVYTGTHREPVWADGPAIFVGGAAREVPVAVHPQPPPTLQACLVVALSMARTIVATAYREAGFRDLDDALQRAGVPSMAPPFHVATVTARGIDMERFDR